MSAPHASQQTLDGIFSVNARRSPDLPALRDPPDRDGFADGPARSLTYAQAERAVNALAGRLIGLGLPTGSVVGMQMPNIVETIVAMLAATRAGLVAAPLPLLFREAEVSQALSAASARALIVCSHVGATDHGSIALHAGMQAFGVRFVCAFGTTLPDGIVPLDDIWTADEDAPEPRSHDTALVTFDTTGGELRAVARTHTEMLVGGLAVVLESGLPKQSTLLETMLPASFAAIASGFVAWLLTGGTLALHHPFDPQVLADQITSMADTTLILPGPVLGELGDGGTITPGATPARILALWRTPQAQAMDRAFPSVPVTDILAFSEIAMLPLRRDDGLPASPRLGPFRPPSGQAESTLLTLAVSEHGTLALSGPMVPASLRGEDAAVDTGLRCHADGGVLGWGHIEARPAEVPAEADEPEFRIAAWEDEPDRQAPPASAA